MSVNVNIQNELTIPFSRVQRVNVVANRNGTSYLAMMES